MEKKLTDLKRYSIEQIATLNTDKDITSYYLALFGKNGTFTKALKQLKDIPAGQKPSVGKLANQVKQELEIAFENRRRTVRKGKLKESIDITAAGTGVEIGHLHIVTQAIDEITRIFERIGFTRVRYPEVEWDWYAFESLNMPKNHPARDEWETFFIDGPISAKFGRLVLTPHTSNGQVRGMENLGKPPIRMINIAKCYRRQSDISHIPMFHQFEGMYIDTKVSIPNLKWFIDYFIKQFFGPDRKFRLRPFHFQFTEPSFEVDISCDFCSGRGCRLCKEGWLELAGCGMIHPNVLKFGGIDPKMYSGFAIGWGIERTYMMKSGTKLDDIRLLYSNDIRFLEQF